MQTVLLHVLAATSGLRCELRRHAMGAWQPVAGHDLPPEPAPGPQAPPSEVGEHLAGLLLHGDTRRAWEELRDASGPGMRTLVQVDPPELEELPWELVGQQRALFPHPRHLLVRARGVDRSLDLAHVRQVPPLRLLLVVDDPADAAGVERVVADAGGRIDAEELVAPAPGVLAGVHARMRPHVLHAAGRAATRLGTIGAPGPRLVVLDRGPERAGPLTAALLDARTCAVLRLPDELSEGGAAGFISRLYAALATEEPVDLAVALADETLPAGTTARPVLTVRVHPEQVLRFAPLFDSGGRRTSVTGADSGNPPPERIGPLLERAEARLARGDPRAPATFQAAIEAAQHAAGALGGMPGRVRAIRIRLAAALAWFDRLRDADAEARDLLAAPLLDADLRRELHLLAAEIAMRCGHAAAAVANARNAGDGYRATAVRVRAALCGPRPAAALGIATAAASATRPAGLELAGATAAVLMRLDDATWLLDEAVGAWLGRDDPEGIVRCHARSATVLMRGYGDLTDAAERLADAADVYVPVGSPAWVMKATARLELLGLQGRAEEAAREVAAVLDALRGPAGKRIPPRRFVRLAVDALAVCSPEQRAGLLGQLVDELGRVTPPAARAVLLSGLCRLRDLAGPGTAALLAQLRDLVRGADHDPAHTTADRARLSLTLAELDRLSGQQAEAEAALAFLRDALPSPIARRAWWSAMDRLGPPLSRTTPRRAELAAVGEGTEELPLLAAAFLIERAEAQREVDITHARRLVRDAGLRLAEAPEKDTHWHLRLRRLQDDLLPRPGDRW